MDKKGIYDSFLKSLRIALANTSVYSKDHPLFIKSVDNLRIDINKLCAVISPLRMGIIPDFLIFGKEPLKGVRLYEEIAIFFHQRKVKAVAFKQGVDNKELINFLINANLAPKDILLNGGLDHILKELSSRFITVEDLDYSKLLKDDGQEDSDIWLYLLRKTLDEDEVDKLDILSNDFEKVLKKLRLQDLVENHVVRKSIKELLCYFKDKDIDKFSECSKKLTKTVLKDGGQLNQDQLDKFKELMEDIEVKDISDVLLDKFQEEEGIDPLTVSLFSKLIDKDKRKEVTISLIDELKKDQQLKREPNVIPGIKDLLTSSEFSKDEAKNYHDDLIAILDNIKLGDGLYFDRKKINNDYHLILLDIFVMELSSERVEAILNIILDKLKKAIKVNNLGYIENFKKALEKKKLETFEFEFAFERANKELHNFVEKIIFKEDCLDNITFLIDDLKKSNLGINFYFDEIFKEEKINQNILKLFFKFFPEQLSSFCENISKKKFDMKFIENIIKNLDKVEETVNLRILKYIFPMVNDLLKLKVLDRMGKLNIKDEMFLFSVFNKGNFLQRKHALLLLANDSSLRDRIAQMLLGIRNLFGFKTSIIKDNLNLINEVPFPEAKAYLIALSKYRFFWNKDIRLKAKEILIKNEI